VGATFFFFLFAKKLTVTFRDGVILQLVKVCIKKNCAEKTKRGRRRERERETEKRRKTGQIRQDNYGSAKKNLRKKRLKESKLKTIN
jgi:hypothetical protein